MPPYGTTNAYRNAPSPSRWIFDQIDSPEFEREADIRTITEMQTTNPWVAWHCNAVSVTHATWQISLRRLRTSEELHPEVRPKDHWSNVPRQRPSPPHQLDCTARTSHSSDTHFSLSSLRSLVCKQDAISPSPDGDSELAPPSIFSIWD